jgi:hypothetical protein
MTYLSNHSDSDHSDSDSVAGQLVELELEPEQDNAEFIEDPDERFENIMDELDISGFYMYNSEGVYELRQALEKGEPFTLPDPTECNASDIINLLEEGKRDNIEQLDPIHSWIIQVMEIGDLFCGSIFAGKDFEKILASLIISGVNAFRNTGFNLEEYLQALHQYGEPEEGLKIALHYYVDKRDAEGFIFVCKAKAPECFEEDFLPIVNSFVPKFAMCDQLRIQEFVQNICSHEEHIAGQN